MLTGNKDEDLSMLKTLYDQYGRQALTNNYNVNYEILKNLDIKSLNRFCSTNKNAREICDDTQFWTDKFNNDDLPILIHKCNNIKDWVKLYILTKQAKEDVRRILLIKKISGNNVILIKGRKGVLYTIFNVRTNSKENGIVKIENVGDKYTYIINNNTYDLEHKKLIHGLIFIQYCILINLDYSITDDEKIPYILNDDIIQKIINEHVNFYYDHNTELSNRLVMNNTVSYIEKNPELLSTEWNL